MGRGRRLLRLRRLRGDADPSSAEGRAGLPLLVSLSPRWGARGSPLGFRSDWRRGRRCGFAWRGGRIPAGAAPRRGGGRRRRAAAASGTLTGSPGRCRGFDALEGVRELRVEGRDSGSERRRAYRGCARRTSWTARTRGGARAARRRPRSPARRQPCGGISTPSGTRSLWRGPAWRRRSWRRPGAEGGAMPLRRLGVVRGGRASDARRGGRRGGGGGGGRSRDRAPSASSRHPRGRARGRGAPRASRSSRVAAFARAHEREPNGNHKTLDARRIERERTHKRPFATDVAVVVRFESARWGN